MNGRMSREEIRKLMEKMGYAPVSDDVIDRVMDIMNCHYAATDPMVASVIQNTLIGDEVKALRGDVHSEAKKAAKIGATEGAKIGAKEGVKEASQDFSKSITNLSGSLQGWLDKGFVALHQNNGLVREFLEKIKNGGGVTLKVKQVALSPQARRELLAALPEATVTALINEIRRSLRWANALVLVLLVIVFVMGQYLWSDFSDEQVRLTENQIRDAAAEARNAAEGKLSSLLRNQEINSQSQRIPRNIALILAEDSAEQVVLNAEKMTHSPFPPTNKPTRREKLIRWLHDYAPFYNVSGLVVGVTGFFVGRLWVNPFRRQAR